MKNSEKLTANIGTEAKARISELQAELIKAGFSPQRVSAGKLVACLLLQEDALTYLKKNLPRESE